jgi:hypothetical protein
MSDQQAIQALDKLDATISNAISALRMAQVRIRGLTGGNDGSVLRDKMLCMSDGLEINRTVLYHLSDHLEHYCNYDPAVTATAKGILCEMFLDVQRHEKAKEAKCG